MGPPNGCRKHGYNLALTRDLSVSPCDDFYAHTCGNWNRLYSVPIASVMRLQAQRVTYKELTKYGSEAGSAAAFYATCEFPKSGNEEAALSLFAVWKRSVGLLWPERRQTAKVHPLGTLLRLSLNWNVNLLFTVRINADRRRPGRTFFFGTGTLNERQRRKRGSDRQEVFEHIVADHCRVLNASASTGNLTQLKAVVDALYGVVLKARTYDANTDQIWIRLSAIDEYMAAVSGDLWRELLSNILARRNVQVDLNDTIVVRSGRLLLALDEIFTEYAQEPESLLEGISWLVIERFLWVAGEAPSLRFGAGDSALLSKKAACIDLVDSQLGLRSTAGWLRRRFNATNRLALDTFLGGLVQALRDGLAGLSWIDRASLQEATLKLSNLKFDVLPIYVFFGADGMVDLFRDFDAVVDKVTSFMGYFIWFANILRRYLGSNRYEGVYHRRLADVDTRLAEYFYYTNSMRISLASLEPPLYSSDGTYAMNYGGLGSYVARELSRVLDDVGTLVDFQGSTRTWWGPTTSADYRDRLACDFDPVRRLIYFNRSPDDGTAGNTSAGEGGDLRLQLFPHMPALETAYRAFKRAVASGLESKVGVMHLPNLEDYTDEQVFFLTYCHALGAPAGERRAQRLCNVPLSNFRAFAEAFGCPVGSPMNPKKKCTFFDSS
ncbi:membrane metallo-endopeptidase-like 1 [Rhipicephalus sanguineus]|uniref:membrane metallo-endopeptidase-like 1 n=1 Tax=Rhipicephalus sanguineus TaxID=34632 RepID=UPI0018943E75|nr:membrane metallo-endopeptidase-like 1 [Rhipicephalus sanguineus]